MSKLPVLLSIPHGGTEIPEELKDHACITPEDQLHDGDGFTRQIYGIKDQVAACVEASIARAFVDLNRDVDDLPPQNPDGIIKSMTCHGKPIYHPGKNPGEELIQTLIDKYYHPYHETIRSLLGSREDIQLCLDCHSMEPIGPEVAPDSGKPRPLICLGTNHHATCPEELSTKLAKCFQTVFELKEEDVTLNQPFAGGLITRTYGNWPLPWIQVEMNRKLYLADPWFDAAALTIKEERLQELREKFRKTLELFFEDGSEL